MLDLVWNLFRQEQLHDLKTPRPERYRGPDVGPDTVEGRLRELERRHEQLKLVTLSLWSLLRDHSGLLESDLRKYVDNIDLLDGARDGRADLQREKVDCRGCGRTILGTAVTCVYCAEPSPSGNVFGGA